MSDGKIKVCFFPGSHGDWGGASRIIFNIVRNIDRKQFDPIVMLTAEGGICRELESLGVAYWIWPLKSKLNALAYFKHFLKSLKFYRKQQIQLLVLSIGCLGWRPAELLAAKLAKIPVIEHCQRVQKTVFPLGRFSSKVFSSSQYICDQSNLSSLDVTPLYDLVDVERFASGQDIRSELGIRGRDRVVTYLGRKRKSKGIDFFIELVRRTEKPDVSFIIATQRTGRPNEDTYSDQEFAQMVGSDPRIHHVDYRDDVENIYATSDVIVMPSIEPEPCPAVAIETAASGRPIVATNTGATSEFVINGVTGILVAANESAELVQAVHRLLDEPQTRIQLGQNAQSIAREKFVAEPIRVVNDTYARIARTRTQRRNYNSSRLL